MRIIVKTLLKMKYQKSIITPKLDISEMLFTSFYIDKEGKIYNDCKARINMNISNSYFEKQLKIQILTQ